MTAATRIAIALERIADHLDRAKPPAPLTAEQVAERLGVSVDKVYQMARKKELRSTKHGRAVRFAVADIERYLADQRPRLIA